MYWPLICLSFQLFFCNPIEGMKVFSDPSAPVLTSNFQNVNEIQNKTGKLLILSCEATGSPIPNIEWFKNDEKIFIGEKFKNRKK